MGAAAPYSIYLYETTAAAAFDPIPEMKKSFIVHRGINPASLCTSKHLPYLYRNKIPPSSIFCPSQNEELYPYFPITFFNIYVYAVIRGRSTNSILVEENYDNLHCSQLLLFWSISVDNQIWMTGIESTVNKNLNLNSYRCN